MSTTTLEQALLRRCIRKSAFMIRARKALVGYKFENWTRNWIWRQLKKTYEEHGETPPFKLLARKAERQFKDESQLLEIVTELRKIKSAAPLESPSATLEEMNRRLKLQHGTQLAEELVSAIEKGSAREVDKALAKGEQLAATRTDVEEDAGLMEIAKREVFIQRKDKGGLFIPTGMSFIDRRWRGVKRGELYLITGVSGVGKSIMATQAGAKAIAHAVPTLHIPTEMSKAETASRYISRFTGILESRIRGEQPLTSVDREIRDRWMSQNWDRLNRLLRIKRLLPDRGTLGDVRVALRKRERKGFPVKLLIIDSPDHLRSGEKRKDEREETTHIYRGLKAIAGEFNVAVIAVTWVAKTWEGKIATKEAVADNYEKTKQADWFISLNALRIHSEEAQIEGQPGEAPLYLYIGKRRAGESRILVPMVCDLARMRMDTAPENIDEAA